MISPDRIQCEADIREGSFMTLGPRQWRRCEGKPVIIVKETKPDSDGIKGSMSLCQSCLDVFKKKYPKWKDEYDFFPLHCRTGK